MNKDYKFVNDWTFDENYHGDYSESSLKQWVDSNVEILRKAWPNIEIKVECYENSNGWPSLECFGSKEDLEKFIIGAYDPYASKEDLAWFIVKNN